MRFEELFMEASLQNINKRNDLEEGVSISFPKKIYLQVIFYVIKKKYMFS